MHKSLAIIPLLLLAGCGPGTKLGSIAGGECNLPGVHTPQYKVLGKTQYDQDWADDTTEGLVRGCNQSRPLARPATLDKPKAKPHPRKPKAKPVSLPPPKPAPVVIAPTPEPDTVPLPTAKPKKHWWQR